MTESYFDYTGHIIADDSKQVYTNCSIVRAFVCQPQRSTEVFVKSDGYHEILPFWNAPTSVPHKHWRLESGEDVELPNPNFYQRPQYRLFVAMQGKDILTGKTCRWVVRFRIFDKSAFLKQQDLYQLRSLCAAITGDRFGVDHFLNDNVKSNDPLAVAAAVSRRINACRDAQFTSFGLPKEAQPMDPRDRKKRFWSWCFSGDSDLSTEYHHSTGYTLWDDNADLAYLQTGTTKPLAKVAQSLIDRLHGQVKIELTDSITEESVAADAPVYIGVTTRGYTYGYTPDSLLDSFDDHRSTGPYGFADSLSTALLGWTIRKGFDQLVIPENDEFGRLGYVGPKFSLYSPDDDYDKTAWKTIKSGGFRAQASLDSNGDVIFGSCELPIFELPRTDAIYKKIDFDRIVKVKKEESKTADEIFHDLFDEDI